MMPARLDVSHETIRRLKQYENLLRKWNPRINLVSKATLQEAWQRHIVDSAQIFDLAPHPVNHWVDLGSGGGFPGLVIAIMAMDKASPAKVTLVESNTRKAAFLGTVIRQTGAVAKVENRRIEESALFDADVISARALADLSQLLRLSEPHLCKTGTAIFMKGQSWEKEIEPAARTWRFTHQVDNSITRSGSVILRISGVSRV